MLFFDEDCNARYHCCEAGTMVPADLDHIVDDLTGTDVKTLVIGTNGQNAMYPGAKAVNEFTAGFDMERGLRQPWFGDSPGSASSYRNAANIVVLAGMGVDSNDYLVRRARAKGISPWLTIRMNDQHSTWLEHAPGHSALWSEHPELRTRSHAPQSGLSYAHPAVRETFFNVIRENLTLYDVDGIVIDWMRHVPHFDDGEGASHIPLMNEYMREIRGLVDDFAARRGHRISIAARVPATVASARYHGLDAAEWARRGSIDRIIISPKYLRNYTLDPSAWKAAVGDENFPVTACIDTPNQPYPGYPADGPAGAWSHEPFDRRQLPFIRGACRVALGNGSNGIYLFNFMNVRNKRKMPEVFTQCGSWETLQGKNFSIDIGYDDLEMDEGTFLKGWRAKSNDAWFSEWRRKLKEEGRYPYPLPRRLAPGESCRFTFATGKVPEASPLVAFSFEGAEQLEVIFNGGKCGSAAGRYLMPLEKFTGISASVDVTNVSGKAVEILRASMHFSWDGTFPELYDPAGEIRLGTAADL